jgi:hypothetical protein
VSAVSNTFPADVWGELATRGYVHVRQFLSEQELLKVQKDYRAQFAKTAANGNYEVPVASPLLTWSFESKLQNVAEAVRDATGIDADMTLCGLYFATEKGISFPWHQDHESFFMYQQHSNYLNFYIPIDKPDRTKANLSLVPFDRLQECLTEPLHRRLQGAGATRLFPEGTTTRVCEDESGAEFTLPVNIEHIKETPQTAPGDLLLLRGDMIHRTHDADSARVAVSFRRTRGDARIAKDRFLSGAPKKLEMMSKNESLYAPLRACFESLQRDEITARQLAAFLLNRNHHAEQGA